jgi:ATP-binding cassette, subfamily B, bacterial MsbA
MRRAVQSPRVPFGWRRLHDRFRLPPAPLAQAGVGAISTPLQLLHTTGRLLSYVRPYLPFHILSVLCAGIHRAAFLVSPWMARLLIDQVFGKRDVTLLPSVVGMMIGASLLAYLNAGVGECCRILVSSRTRRDMQLDVYRHLRRLRCTFHDVHTTGEAMAIIESDVQVAGDGIRDIGGDLVTSGAQFLVTLGFIFVTQPKLGLFSLPLIAVLVVFPIPFRNLIEKVAQQLLAQRSHLMSLLQESLAGSRELKALGHELRDVGNVSRSMDAQSRTEVKEGVVYSVCGLATLANSTWNALFFLVGGQYVLSGQMSLGTLWMASRYLNLLGFPLVQMQSAWQKGVRALVGASRVFRFLDENKPERMDGAEMPCIRGDVEFEDVHFAYSPCTPVLRGISFRVRAGELIALVGPSGAGKSTILNLIPQFYDPASGRVLVDGRDVQELRLRSLRAAIGIVLQDPYLFSGTVEENIRMGATNPDAVSLEEVISAAKVANAHMFITALPDGYATRIGERGIRLSGGERQRVAIARAVIRSPRILLLDEATSALDNETERLVQQALERLRRGRTSFVIAHRLSTVLGADRILVVQDGQIVEEGQHRELLERNGLYARLYRVQFETEASSLGVEPV